MATIKKHKIITTVILVVSTLIILMFFNPIHYLNLYLLKFRFLDVQKIQPTETHFIWRKNYIGNPGWRGSWRCNYTVGELRSFSGSREKVVEQYQEVLDRNDDAGILFMDGDKWPLDSILWDWRGEFLDQNNIEEGKYYIVYISQKFPALLYTRCKVW